MGLKVLSFGCYSMEYVDIEDEKFMCTLYFSKKQFRSIDDYP